MFNGIKMNVVQTAKEGIVNHETIFHFQQIGKTVEAKCAGGKIKKGYLVGLVEGNVFNFTYCQLRVTGEIDHGISECKLSMNAKTGKLTMHENFKMKTENSIEAGVNIFREI